LEAAEKKDGALPASGGYPEAAALTGLGVVAVAEKGEGALEAVGGYPEAAEVFLVAPAAAPNGCGALEAVGG